MKWLLLAILVSVSALQVQADSDAPEPPKPSGFIQTPAQGQKITPDQSERVSQATTTSDDDRQIFTKPEGPPAGGTIDYPHPDAGKGLLRIDKDNVYEYKTPLRDKSQSITVTVTTMQSPNITGIGGVTFKSMYGSDLTILSGDYEWDPFRSFGELGIQLGTGVGTAHGNGWLAYYGVQAEETYNIYVVPLSVFGIYRFEYARRQWIVPFVNGGIIYYGMMEQRDDGASPHIAGAPAAGGGGGLNFSISRFDSQSAFTLAHEYGVSDMWLTVQLQVVQGLSQDIDFTSTQISAGITVDY